MTQKGWRKTVLDAVSLDAKGNSLLLDDLVSYLAEVDRAKSILQDKGYGVTGESFINMVRNAPER